ncbi:MAG: GNAT family N-acetyltransferase [Lachnospiraceae bacterium]|nr:GNAT family N-acetyltransferase [Lachnospiraceae bacterium]
MKNIRKATKEDLARIAEIVVFNYRLNFYPIFKNDDFYFGELQVLNLMESYQPLIETMWVYDDGAIKGFVQVDNKEIKKLFVEPALQGNAIGSKLLNFAIDKFNADFLWALEKNIRAIKFYHRHGFSVTSEKKLEEDTTEYLVRMERDILKETNRSE